MSRSIKRTPKNSMTNAESEKDNKRQANRQLRRLTKIELKKGDKELSARRELSNVDSFDKDGKHFLKRPTQKDLRK